MEDHFPIYFPYPKNEEQQKRRNSRWWVLKAMWCLHPQGVQISLRFDDLGNLLHWTNSQAETLAVLDDKLEDVHLSAFQPCGKAWQAAITCTFGLEKKDIEVKCIY